VAAECPLGEFSVISRWHNFEGDSTDWDSYVRQLPNANVFQSSAWADLQRRAGWIPLRLSSLDAGAALQAFSRSLSRLVSVTWIPGGIAGLGVRIDVSLLQSLSGLSDCWVKYVRLGFPSPTSTHHIVASPWRDSHSSLGAERSVLINLRQDEETLLQGAGPNWRRNLKRARREDLSVRRLNSADARQLDDLEQSMNKTKKLPAQKVSSGEMLKHFGSEITVVGVYDQHGELVSTRGASTFGSIARDMIAATSDRGRRNYASYLATWSLLQELRALGTGAYDLGGIDVDRNRGVADFKLGIGGTVVTYQHEIESCVPRVLSSSIGKLLSLRN